MTTPRQLLDAAARVVFPIEDPDRRSVILCYHSIHPTAPFASATPSEFDEHLDWLQEHCDVVSLERIRDAHATDGVRVALTFDDGFADNWQYALPRLSMHGFTATFFLTIGFLERTPAALGRMAELWRVPTSQIEPLHWDDVAEMRDAGMSFGSHTLTHPNLAAVDARTAWSELEDSRRRLEDRLQQSITEVAYPFGKPRHHVTRRTVDMARSCRYRRGVTTVPRAVAPTDPDLSLPRHVIGNDSVAHLSEKVRGAIDWHAQVRAHLPRALSERSLPGGR